MRSYRFLAIPLVMLFILACGLTNGIQGIATQIPGVLTSMPTALGAVETISAQQSSSNCPSTPSAGGLGISLYNVKSILEITNQVTFTDGTVNGQPASTATLSQSAAATFPTLSSGFSALFIGDPCNLTEIKVTIPRTDQQATVDEGMGLINIIFAGFMPPEVQLPMVAWLVQEYGAVPVGGQQQKTFGTIMATLSRTASEMVLDIVPAK